METIRTIAGGTWEILSEEEVKSLSCVRLFATTWTVAQDAPPSMGLSKQEYWSGVPLPSPSGKDPTCQFRRCKRCRFDPWVRKIPWRRKWLPTPVFLPGKSHWQRSLMGCSPWDHKELGTNEWLTLSLGTLVHHLLSMKTFWIKSLFLISATHPWILGLSYGEQYKLGLCNRNTY